MAVRFQRITPNIPSFQYLGSKKAIRDWVIQHMPMAGRIYFEPFAGRGNSFFLSRSRLRFQHWQLNDWRTAGFLQALSSVDVSLFPKADFNGRFVTREVWLDLKQRRSEPLSLVMEPIVSHMGHYRSGWSGEMTRPVFYNRTEWAERILAARHLLVNCLVLDWDWQEIDFTGYDESDFLYFDPPYFNTDLRHYPEMFHHHAFLLQLKTLSCRWLLSSSYNKMYAKHLGKPMAVLRRRSALKAKGQPGQSIIECLWKGNY